MASLIRRRAAAERPRRPLLAFAARLPCSATIAWLRRSRSASSSAMMADVSMDPLFVGLNRPASLHKDYAFVVLIFPAQAGC